MTEATKERRAYRICPCSAYDVEGIQTWLEDLAREGLLLEKEGFFGGIFTFLKTTPQRATYRLEPVQKKQSFFADINYPEPDIIELSGQLGWDFLVRYGIFYIYRSTAPYPRELHTDLEVQNIALDTVRKRQQSTLLWTAALVCSWFFLQAYGFRYVFRNAITVSVVYTVAYLLFILWFVLDPIRALAQLHAYRKRLCAGEPLTRKSDWKHRSTLHIFYRVLPVILVLLIVSFPLATLIQTADRIPIEEYTANPPFVTIEDMIPGGIYENSGNIMGDYNTLLQWSTALAPVNIEWDEDASVRDNIGNVCSGILHVDYHETLAPWLAEGLFRDYYDYEANRYHGKNFEDLDAPQIPADEIRVFRSYGILHILLRQNHVVLHATVLLKDQAKNDLWESWAVTAANQLEK